MTSLPIVSRFWSSRRTAELSHAPDLHALWQYPRLLPKAVATDPLVQHYLDLLGPLNWSQFPERDLLTQRGMPAVPFVPFVAACLVKLDQHLRYFSHLRQYLLDHPSLSWTLGFPALSPAKTTVQLPSQRHFPRLLRKVPNASLQFLLDETVRLLRHELVTTAPDFGDTVALDTKHILAWVRENNPRDYVKDRFAKDHQPADPDCALGCKRKHNQHTKTAVSPPTPDNDPVPAQTIAVSEYYWGYASGIVTTKVPHWGEFVLAELTQPFNISDVAYFFPLMAAVERRLGFRPHYAALDAAYDAFYVYEYFHRIGEDGFAAVPLSTRGGAAARKFDPQGLPLCNAGLAMPLKSTYHCKTTRVPHERGRYACPLVYPATTGKHCPVSHKKWAAGGCITTLATSVGARIRHQLDRESDAYKRIYNQRTVPERLFSLAKDLGIERPKLRNGQAIANLNTLIYVLLNLRALQRVKHCKSAKK